MIGQFEEILLKYNEELTKNDFEKLDRSLRQLTSALAEHMSYLDRQTSAMANLTQAIKTLNATIKKENRLEFHQASLKLTEAVTSFMEHQIDPEFYKDKNVLQLEAAPPVIQPKPLNINQAKDSDILDRELKNLYTLILKNVFENFDGTSSPEGVSSTNKLEEK